jgi:hypothetical protein
MPDFSLIPPPKRLEAGFPGQHLVAGAQDKRGYEWKIRSRQDRFA